MYFNILIIMFQSAYMVAHVRTNRVFSGRMYGRTRPNSCVVDIDRSLDFELKLGYNDIDCDVVNRGPGKFTSEVVIQVAISFLYRLYNFIQYQLKFKKSYYKILINISKTQFFSTMTLS